jgi:ribosome-associated heat shock protein Hsp15
MVAEGSIRINRQATCKPHARIRIGDVLTLPIGRTVRVLRVAALAERRGPATAARLLYVDISDVTATACAATDSAAYRGA